MVAHNPVKLVLKQTLILKNSATINIYLCSAAWQTDWSPRQGTERPMCLCQSEAAAWARDSLSTDGCGIGFLSKCSQRPTN